MRQHSSITLTMMSMTRLTGKPTKVVATSELTVGWWYNWNTSFPCSIISFHIICLIVATYTFPFTLAVYNTWAVSMSYAPNDFPFVHPFSILHYTCVSPLSHVPGQHCCMTYQNILKLLSRAACIPDLTSWSIQPLVNVSHPSPLLEVTVYI